MIILQISVDDKSILDYDHRITDLNKINCISLDGHLEINSIRFTQEDEEEEEMESSMDEGVIIVAIVYKRMKVLVFDCCVFNLVWFNTSCDHNH